MMIGVVAKAVTEIIGRHTALTLSMQNRLSTPSPASHSSLIPLSPSLLPLLLRLLENSNSV